MTEVLPGKLYLGNIVTAKRIKWIIKKGIKKIVNVSNTRNDKLRSWKDFPYPIEELEVKITDVALEKILDVLDLVEKFVESEPKGAILFHCFAGRSRSAALCIAYLMKYEGMSLVDATCFLEKKRPKFLSQLFVYEKRLVKEGILSGDRTIDLSEEAYYNYFCTKSFAVNNQESFKKVLESNIIEYFQSKDGVKTLDNISLQKKHKEEYGICFDDLYRKWEKNERELIARWVVFGKEGSVVKFESVPQEEKKKVS